MKKLLSTLSRYLPRSILFGLVMTALSFPMGRLRFGMQSPPVWIQLGRLFLIYAAVFLLVNVLGDLIASACRRHKQSRK